MELIKIVADEPALLTLASQLAQHLKPGLKLYFSGELGAGKTTFCRGMLRALGYAGPVKSPTYTLVQSYTVHGLTIHHFDLYRLQDRTELDFMGFQDYLDPAAILWVEWPEKAGSGLPIADLEIQLSCPPDGGRQVIFRSGTESGEQLLREGIN